MYTQIVQKKLAHLSSSIRPGFFCWYLSIIFYAWDKGLIRYFSIFHYRYLGSNLHPQNPEKILEGKHIRFWPTLSSGLSWYRVMVNSRGVLSRKNYGPRVTSKVNKIPIGWLIGDLLVCTSLIFCCVCIYCIVVCVLYCLLSLARIPCLWAWRMRKGTPSLGLE